MGNGVITPLENFGNKTSSLIGLSHRSGFVRYEIRRGPRVHQPMIESVISFTKSGLDDDEATRARNVNGFAGCRCAVWLRDGLAPHAAHLEFDNEPTAEDWGWAMVVKLGDDLFILGCSADEETPSRWRVMIGDNFSRGLTPWTRKRKTAAARRLAADVEAYLRAQPDVSDVAVESG